MFRITTEGNFLVVVDNTTLREHIRHPLGDSAYKVIDQDVPPIIKFTGGIIEMVPQLGGGLEFPLTSLRNSLGVLYTENDISTFNSDWSAVIGFKRGGGNGIGVVANHIFVGDTRALSETARDSYFTTNPNELIASVQILLSYLDGGVRTGQLQFWDGSDWANLGATISGEALAALLYDLADTNRYTDADKAVVTSLDDVADDRIPLKTSTGYVSSGIRRLADGTILAPEGFQVESSSIEFGDLVTLHENNSFLRLSNKQFPEVSFDLLDSRSRRGAESDRPRQFALIEAQNEFTLSNVEDSTITLTDFTFSYTATLDAQTNIIKFKVPTGEVCTNLRARTYYSTGNQTVIKYLPTKEAWLDGVGGYNFTDGEQEVDSGFSNFRTFVGDQVSIQIQGDVVNLLGTSTNIPYTKLMLQRGEFRNIAYLSDITVNPPISPSGTFTSFNIDGQSTSVTTPFTLSGNQTFNFSINNPSLFTGNLTILQGDAVLLDTISTTSTSSIISVTSSTLSNVGDNEVFTIRGTNTDGTVVSRTFTIHASGSGQLVYYGLSATDNPASVDLSTLQSIAVGTGVIDINTGVVTDGQYFIILDPSNNAIVSITDDVLQQDVTEFFTMTPTVRSIDSINYNSYVIGPLNADAEGETYTLMLR